MRQPAKRKKKVNLKQTAFTRFMLIIAVFVLWIGGIGARLVHLQITQHDWLTKECEERTKTRTRSRQLRGSIFASDFSAAAAGEAATRIAQRSPIKVRTLIPQNFARAAKRRRALYTTRYRTSVCKRSTNGGSQTLERRPLTMSS